MENSSPLDYLKLVKEREERLRNCYAEPIQLNSDEFVNMILVDAAFIVEVFLRLFVDERKDGNDPLLCKPQIVKDLGLDMLLLENQLPFFILEDLFNRANAAVPSSASHDQRLSFTRITCKFLKELWDLEEVEEHILESKFSGSILHLVDCLRIYLQPPMRLLEKRPIKRKLTTSNLVDLRQAGIRIKLRSSKNLFDIKFKYGVLEIPKLRMFCETRLLFRNLLAFEQYHCSSSYMYVNDYIIMISQMISSRKDEKLLVDSGIAENWLGNNMSIENLFQELVQAASFSADHFYFSDLIQHLNGYCSSSWHRYMLFLRRDYFGEPWAMICVMQSIVLFVLTVIQVVYAVKSSGTSTTAKGN